jgi:predicted kinase
MRKILILQGIPASGKSTWSKQFLKDNPRYLRVNRDGIRRTLIGDTYDVRVEKIVTQLQESMMETILGQGKNVLLDNTSVKESYINEILNLARRIGNVDVATKIFDTPFEECCRRNDLRVGVEKVPQGVMVAMYKNFQNIPKVERTWNFGKERKEPILNVNNLPCAIMCDIDGTIALNYTRSPFEWGRVGEDSVNEPIVEILREYRSSERTEYKIILMSGRDSVCRGETIAWLERFRIPFDELHMRAEKDMRGDDIVKRELYEANVKGKYHVDFVLDDRNRVVRVWRDLGLTCLQVAEGNF